MPTAAKLVAAIVFGAVAALAAHIYALAMPEGRPAGTLREVSAVVGVLCGWFIMGPSAHRARGRVEAMGTGVRTSFTVVVLVVLIFATTDMLQRSVKGRYDTPMDAILGILEQAMNLSKPLIAPDLLGVLLLGGLFGGALAFWAGRKWN